METDLSKEINFLIEKLGAVQDFNKEIIEKEFRSTVDELGLKMKVLVHPTRIALTGTKTGPGLFETIEVLGKERVLKRLSDLVKYWSDNTANPA